MASSPVAQSTLIQRPGSSARLASEALGQSARWTDTPKPRVIKPTTGSPGTGVQHLANLTRQLSMPSTMMPDWLVLPPRMGTVGGLEVEG